jgi:hypothetical protein
VYPRGAVGVEDAEPDAVWFPAALYRETVRGVQ